MLAEDVGMVSTALAKSLTIDGVQNAAMKKAPLREQCWTR